MNIQKETKLIKKGNLNLFYQHVRKRTKNKAKIPPLLDPNGIAVFSEVGKSIILKDHFSPVFGVDNHIIPMNALSKCQLSSDFGSRLFLSCNLFTFLSQV